MPAKGIAQTRLLDEVDIAAEDSAKLLDHLGPLVETPWGALGKINEDVHIAVRTEISAQDRSEKGKLDDLPLAVTTLPQVDVEELRAYLKNLKKAIAKAALRRSSGSSESASTR